MLDIRYLRDNYQEVSSRLALRGGALDLGDIVRLVGKRAATQHTLDELRHDKNLSSERIQQIRAKGEDASKEIEAAKTLSQRIKQLEEDLRSIDAELDQKMLMIPNIPHESVPVGKSSEDNVTVRQVGEPPKFQFEPKPHFEIGEALGILDFKTAAKITGARFVLYKGRGARLERALINFMLDLHTKEHGYLEVFPPFMVNRESMTGTGQLPKFEEDLFKLANFDYYLIPTAEVPVTNIHRDEILSEEDMPLRYVAYTPCFRSEAGSYGKDTRGLIRQHQFDKVELVKFCTPQSSYDELEKLTADAEEVLKRLGIPYRVVVLCTGDLGFASAKTYDIEAWFASQSAYREISSCSNFAEFQARRAMIRYRGGPKGKVSYAHTLNGSGLAIGRTLAAILENFQRPDGSVEIPDPLVPYMDGVKLLEAK